MFEYGMRWSGQSIEAEQGGALPGLERLAGLVRSVTTPEFDGITFHEVLAKSALNRVPSAARGSRMAWTINPYRGCSHACVYCFARPTHEYLDLDAGEDFERQIVVKVNVGEVLQRELARPSWDRAAVALGTNTDPYQRAEGRYRLMPGVIAAFAASGTPFSILTKGALLRRDLPLLREAATQVPVGVAMSIAVFDPALERSVEPGVPAVNARLETIRLLRDAGFAPSVLLMPVLPYLTDSKAHLDTALRRIAEAGAVHVAYTALHLRGSVKPWYLAWLEREHPGLLTGYRRVYGEGGTASREYRRWLADRIQPLIRAHGLDRGETSRATGGVAPPSRVLTSGGAGSGLIAAELPPAAAAALQPRLF